MQKGFIYGKFNELNLENEFFDSLKNDYPEFDKWFNKKSNSNTPVYYCKDNKANLLAMMYFKYEKEELILQNSNILAEKRIKIGTLKISETSRNQRIGEGAIGLSLWEWQKSDCNQIYVTVFDKHVSLIRLLLKFGFSKVGRKLNGELVLIKDKRTLKYSNPFISFPYINPNFDTFGMIPIKDKYHDILFPFSKLQSSFDDSVRLASSNGMTKTFICSPSSIPSFIEGSPVFIYRKFSGDYKRYRSVITSICTISKMERFTKGPNTKFEDFKAIVKNRSALSEQELLYWYSNKSRLIIIDLVYNYFFGCRNNINYDYLKNNGLFNEYPYGIRYNPQEVLNILNKGKADVQDIIIN